MHVLQPKHTRLSDDEKEKFLKKFNTGLAQLPKISSKDPAIPQDCKTGDVVKIEREGDMPEIYYRVVV